ncbi:MAG: FIST N-terminal domain-containing protein [Methanobacteriota archaeon]
MRVTTFYGESPEEILTNIERSPISSPTLGIIFSSVSLGIPELAERLERCRFPIIGCSSAGEILNGGGTNPLSELTAVGCLIDLNPDSFKTRIFERMEKTPSSLGEKIGRWGSDQFKDPVFFILISGLTNDGEAVIKGIEQVFSSPPQIFGGVAADDGKFEETFVFSNNCISSDGVAAIVFDGSVFNFFNLITSGWRGVGAEKIITKSEGNIVYFIDNRPAIEFYTDYLNLKEEDIPHLSVDFPLIVRRVDDSVVIRTPLAVDKEHHGLVFAGSVPQGSAVTFSSSPGRETIQNSVCDINQCSDQVKDADLVLLISCMARYQATGGFVIDEINAAIDIGPAPLVGFFSYGEIGNNELGRCEFNNETFSLVAITEKRTS